MFLCDQCGLCCMQVGSSEIYTDLDRGDGICHYFNMDAKLCSIYEERPLLCNVDKMYEAYFKNLMSLDEYYAMNQAVCKKLKEQADM